MSRKKIYIFVYYRRINSKRKMKQKLKKKSNIFNKILNHSHNTIMNINTSKVFAGLVIITLNIASRFVTIKLSKSMESYLKFTFSKQILIFAIAWMGTRDIYIALLITIIFIILMDYLFNEDSMFCCLPKSFMDHHINLLDNDKVSDEDIQKAKDLLQKADSQKAETTGATGATGATDQNQNILQQGPNILPQGPTIIPQQPQQYPNPTIIPQNRNIITPFPAINSM